MRRLFGNFRIEHVCLRAASGHSNDDNERALPKSPTTPQEMDRTSEADPANQLRRTRTLSER